MNMSSRSVLYKILQSKNLPTSALKIYSSTMLFEGMGFLNFSTHCAIFLSSVIKNGSAVEMTSLISRRRTQLGLSETARFDQTDIRKIAEITGLSKVLREKTK